MHSLLLSLLLIQGVPIQPQQGGTVTGVLRDADGKPVPGVRVAAVAVPESPTEAQAGSSMGAIAETDAAGQYRLENIPPGRYYIAAGRLDLPTYYPGTQEMSKGTIVGVTAGISSSPMNFTLQTSSAGRIVEHSSLLTLGGLITLSRASSMLLLPIDIRLEDGGKVPAFGPTGFVRISLKVSEGGERASIFSGVKAIQIEGPGPLDFHVAVENLPPGYSLKSIAYDGTPLRSGTLHLSAKSFSTPVLTSSQGTNFAVLQLQPTPPLVITLVRAPVVSNGARVRGTAPDAGTRSIYLSGRPGLLFIDGTFEFSDVPPGRHSIATLNGSPLAASVVVGDSNLEGVPLVSTPTLPVGIREPVPPASAGTHAPGFIPLVSLRGSTLSQTTQQPIANGMAFLTGGAFGASRPLNEDGTFEFSSLLPGKYNLEILPFGFETIKRTVIVEDAGVNVRFEALPASR